jgi:flagellar hook-associated protein 1 FlgK
MSLTSSLYTVLSALDTDQGAISVTSNNIANVNTPGYSREVAQLAEAQPETFANQQFGTGVQLTGIQGIRDNLLQLRLNQEAQTQGQLQTFVNGMTQIQPVFNEAVGSGLQGLMSQFFNSFQSLSTDPTDSGLRQSTITSAQSLAAGFHLASQTVTSQQQAADQGVVQSVGQINSLTSQIAALNGQIATTSPSTGTPNGLLDQRAALVNQLSQLVDVQSITADKTSLTLTTTSGALLLTGNESFNLSTAPNPATGFQNVFDAQGNNITTSIQSGNLAGYIQLRDTELPSIAASLNTLASGIATATNTQNAAGFDLNGAAGGNFFAPPTAVAAASNLTVAITDPSKVAASSDGTPGNSGNATALGNLQTQNVVAGQNPLSYYAGLVFQVGSTISTASSTLAGQSLITQQLQDQQSAESGVSLNEEGANLILYQNAFGAAARVAGVISTLLQTAINLGTPTA